MDLFDIKISCDGDIHEQITRKQRLHFVVGHALARAGSLQFLNSLHDHKGLLTVNMTEHHLGLEAAVMEAWHVAGESAIEFEFETPMEPEQWDRCRKCEARFFCES